MRAAALGVCLSAWAWPALAQVALYGAQPPAGSAYVRFVNATGAALDLRPAFLPADPLGLAPKDRVSAYAVVEKVAGRSFAMEISQSGHSNRAALTFKPDSYNTVLLRDVAGGSVSATVVSDAAEFNQARARLSFYNATPDCGAGALSLAAGASVFTGVGPAEVRTRSVNPVQAMVRASCSGQTADDVMLENMEVGGSYSVWLMSPGGHAAAFVTRDTTLAYKP